MTWKCQQVLPSHAAPMTSSQSLFLASFSLVHISLVFSLSIAILLSFLPCFCNSSSVFPDVLSLAGRRRYLTTDKRIFDRGKYCLGAASEEIINLSTFFLSTFTITGEKLHDVLFPRFYLGW